MKKFFIHPADLHLILNLVDSSESFKTAESWTPICLPKFDSNGFMHGHVSYLAEDCQACLLLLTVDRDVFFTLSEAKQVTILEFSVILLECMDYFAAEVDCFQVFNFFSYLSVLCTYDIF